MSSWYHQKSSMHSLLLEQQRTPQKNCKHIWLVTPSSFQNHKGSLQSHGSTLGQWIHQTSLNSCRDGRSSKSFYNNHGFPQCFGTIDDTHIDINQPKVNSTDYQNRKHRYSLNVQAVCNYKHTFPDVVVKWPGSVRDTCVFANSTVNKQLRTGKIPSCERVIIRAINAWNVLHCMVITFTWSIYFTLAQLISRLVKTVRQNLWILKWNVFFYLSSFWFISSYEKPWNNMSMLLKIDHYIVVTVYRY